MNFDFGVEKMVAAVPFIAGVTYGIGFFIGRQPSNLLWFVVPVLGAFLLSLFVYYSMKRGY